MSPPRMSRTSRLVCVPFWGGIHFAHTEKFDMDTHNENELAIAKKLPPATYATRVVIDRFLARMERAGAAALSHIQEERTKHDSDDAREVEEIGRITVSTIRWLRRINARRRGFGQVS